MPKATRNQKKQKKTTLHAEPLPLAADQDPPQVKALDNQTVHLAILSFVAFVIYSNTFSAPFHFDDKVIIQSDCITALKEIGVNSQTLAGIYENFRTRFISYLTFGLNYTVNGMNVTGYHIVNFLIHLANGILIYFLLVTAFSSDFLQKSAIRHQSKAIAFWTALLFLAHPIQTQAVTYIYQRLTSLATLFYILSLLSYAAARSSQSKYRRNSLFIISAISALLAMESKEIAFTLPVAVALYEFMFTKASIKKRILLVAGFFIALLVVPLTILGDIQGKSLGHILIDVSDVTKMETLMSRSTYLFTEMRVLLTYLRLLVIPVGQNLDYDYPIFYSLFTPEVFGSFLLLLALFSTGFVLWHRSAKSDPAFRLIAYGILWFFITIALESSFIPIADVIFEHRLYLPSIGLFLAAVVTCFLVLQQRKNQRLNLFTTIAACLILLTFAFLTFQRNRVWQNEIRLWEDVVQKSPNKARGYNNLGTAYWQSGLNDQSIRMYENAVRLDPQYLRAINNLGEGYMKKGQPDKAIEVYQNAAGLEQAQAEYFNNFGVAYGAIGEHHKAIEKFKRALTIDPDHFKALNNLGKAYNNVWLNEKAIESFQTAIAIRPDFAPAYINLGTAISRTRSTPNQNKAIEIFNTALKLDPENARTHNLLGNVYAAKGEPELAAKHFRAAIKIDPGSADPYNNLGNIYGWLGQTNLAIKCFEEAIRLKPDFARAHNNLGNAVALKGSLDVAVKHYQRALQLKPDYARAHYNLAETYLAQDNAAKAKKALQNALQLDPGMPEARQLLEKIGAVKKQ